MKHNDITKQILLQIIFWLPVFLLASCSKAIELDSTDMKPQLVVNGVIQPGMPDSLVLTTNYPAIQYQTNTRLSGASIRVMANSNELGTYSETTKGTYIYNGLPLEEGKMYTLEAEADNYPKISSTITIPLRPAMKITHADYICEERKSIGYQDLEASFELIDRAETDDYYMVQAEVLSQYKTWSRYPNGQKYDTIYTSMHFVRIATQSPFNELSGYKFAQNEVSWEQFDLWFAGSLYFSDKQFNGQKITFPLAIDLGSVSKETAVWLYITVSSISREFYDLAKSAAAYRKAETGMFSEALQLYSNIENGLGYWVAKTPVTDSVSIQVKPNL